MVKKSNQFVPGEGLDNRRANGILNYVFLFWFIFNESRLFNYDFILINY